MSAEMPIPENFPLQPGMTLHALRLVAGKNLYQGMVHGYLKDAEDKSVAVVREFYNDRFAEGLRELKFLQAAGIAVARHLPFIGPGGQEHLLVEYVEGERWTWDRADTDPDLYRDTVRKIGNYAYGAIMSGRPVLTDISSCFQFILRGNEPVLVDLDMSMYEATSTFDTQCVTARDVYLEFSEGEGILPPSMAHEASELLAPIYILAKQQVSPQQKPLTR